MSLTKSELAKYMDHTLLKADATAEQIDRVAAEARELNTASVCVNGYWVPRVAASLEGTDVMTCAVIGFPLGAMSTAAKAAETADVVWPPVRARSTWSSTSASSEPATTT